MRRAGFVLGVLLAAAPLSELACSSFGGDEAPASAPDGGEGSPEGATGQPDATRPPDTGVPDVPCNEESAPVVLKAVADASLSRLPVAPPPLAYNVCDLRDETCLYAFDAKDVRGYRLTRVSLKLLRSQTDDCIGPADCNDGAWRQGGSLQVAHVRPDWDETATWQQRYVPTDPDMPSPWTAGTFGPGDHGVLTSSATLGPNDDVDVAIAPSAIDPRWLSADPTAADVIAFAVMPHTPSAGFHFVIQRPRSKEPRTPTLTVRYCLDP